MEYFVNLSPEDAPSDLVSVNVTLPDDVRVDRMEISSLPGVWRSYPAPWELRRIGDRWVEEGAPACLLVPSALVPEEDNLLIHPAHPDFQRLRFEGPAAFRFDPRMWKESGPNPPPL